MGSVGDDAATADRHLVAALAEAAEALERASRRLIDLREEDLRTAVYGAMKARLPGCVRKEQTLDLVAFRGVGGFDLLVDRSPGGPVAWLGEVKWSYTSRSKIFEAVWDAVKLCLATVDHDVTRCWLITGAPSTQWMSAESRELFVTGTVGFHDLWTQALNPPGANSGETVGADLLAGGRGNRFTCTPSAFKVELLAAHRLRPQGEDWSLRAVSITPAGTWIKDFAPAPVFPRIIRQSWLDANVPAMSDELFAELIQWLRLKRWTDEELAERVYPLRPADGRDVMA